MERLTGSPRGRSLLLAVITAAGYAVGSLVAWQLLDAHAAAVFFGSAGVTSAALVASGRRHWPWILVAVAATEVAFDLGHGQSVGVALGLAAANTMEPLTGALLVRRVVGVPDLSKRRDTLAFLTCCVVTGPLVGALLGTATLVVGLDRSWVDTFPTFWAGDALGVLTVGSAVLAWATRDLRRDRSNWQVPRVTALVALTALATLLSFGSSRAPFMLPLAALFLAALAGGVTGVTTSGAAMALTANVISARGIGPWGDLAGSADAQWATLQLFLAIGQLGPWALAIEAAERRRTGAALDAQTRQRMRAELLQPVVARLAPALTVEEVGRAVAEVGLPGLATDGVVGLVDETSGLLRTFRSATEGQAVETGSMALSLRHPLSATVRTGQPMVLTSGVDISDRFPTVAPELRARGVRGLAVIPIVEDGAVVGALLLGFAESGVIAAEVLEAAAELAGITATAAVRARAHERDRDVAHRLQQALLPVVAADPGGAVRVAVGYRPADPRHEVGGDWYDAFTLPDGRLGIAVGDIVGHDLDAATAMGKLQPALRVMAHEAAGPGEVLQRLDQASSHLDGTMMATVGFADYVSGERRLRYACAGHPPPLLLTAAEAVFLGEARGLPLGLDPDLVREHSEVVVPLPAVMVWYTDGLVEAHDESIDAGLERLRVHALGIGVDRAPDELARLLLEQLGEGRPRQDDAVVVCVRL